ncbi:proline--tRNA ligase [Candidatus Woesearchaeota archaeon]|nr:proline--tRNA ligase [Candidatus Woesearchaeota archaeon]
MSKKENKEQTNKEQNAGKDNKGITAKKVDDFSEWYTQVLQKAELIEYSPVSGCYILRPSAYFIWERVQSFFDKLIKDDGVKNVYFPLFIPEDLLTKEKKHVEGFAPEVAWVESGGETKLKERLAVRPTSETIMYDSYAKWIRSHKDLPLRLNQWCNVVRWEFKHPVPFLRSREFLWQEGHTCFAKKSEADEETRKILHFYEQVFSELYAIPVLLGKKSESEKFAGADYTLSVEAFLPNGKAIQGATSHCLGQNFSKAFDISFLDENQQKSYVWQNSWGISTRSIGVMVLMHGDDKGLVVPPKVAQIQVVIVPIMFDDTKEKILKEAKNIEDKLKKAGISVYIDAREGYSPGWKFNEWEVKGVPVRIELGPRDLEKNQAVVVRRDSGEKKALNLKELISQIPLLLEDIHQKLYDKAKTFLKNSIVKVSTFKEAEKYLEEKKLLFAPWCESEECEKQFKEKTGAKSLNTPFEQPKIAGSCFACKNKAKSWFYFGRSY